MKPTVARLLLSLLPFLTGSLAFAQYRLPEGSFTITPGSLEIHSDNYTDSYIFGFGWASGADLPDPFVVGQAVSVSRELLDLVTGVVDEPEPAPVPGFGAAEPVVPAPAPALTPPPSRPQAPAIADPAVARISTVRFGGSDVIRVVFDVPDLTRTDRLEPLTASGSRAADEPLLLPLAGLAAPATTRFAERGVSVEFSGDSVSISPSGRAYSYNVFAVPDPVRLVIDLTPVGGNFLPVAVETVLADPVGIEDADYRNIAPGVTLQQFRYPTGQGSSPVRVLRISPGAGRFEVVGSTRDAATLSDLASGSLAAINAGYFNTSTHDHIGLLRVNGNLETLPSLGRASIGFGAGGIQIARTSAEVHVFIAGTPSVSAPAGRDGVELFETAGQLAGDASRGVLLVSGGRVTANRVGPLTVPAGGVALAYDPEIRQLALLEPGSELSYRVSFDPPFFDDATNAVEAGPLLVDGGQAAFQPELESFQRGIRILDEYTSQSAIGVTWDGTVLMVVADSMRAQDLVPLFISLDARQAMRLDSGGSATLFADGEVLNRSAQRRIVSAIVLKPN